MDDKNLHNKHLILYAAIPIFIFLLSTVIYSAPFFFLLAPFLLVYLVERRKVASLGFVFEKKKVKTYISITVFGFFLQMLFYNVEIYLKKAIGHEIIQLELSPNLWHEFIAQLWLVAIPEEVFYRGYLMTRLGQWLGDRAGLIISSLCFGLTHTISRLKYYGLDIGSAILIGLGALIGGLIFAWQFQKTKSIYPSMITHIAQNLFGSGLLGLFV
ncbi:MAG: CPBP family intramembrane metalloprotease [Anaerolineales bacterium]|nr:CPBP family intramembrane metalloprotease [Anaerolineales bacterium]